MKIISLLIFIYIGYSYGQINTADNKLRIVEEYYPGTIVKKDGTKLEGYVLSTFGPSQYTSVHFRKELNDLDSQRSFKPKDIEGYEIKHLKYKAIHYNSDSTTFNYFARMMTEGCVDLLKYIELDDEGKEVGKLVLESNSQVYPLSQSGEFDKKTLKQVMPDNQTVTSKIETLKSNYSNRELEEIVAEYNASCK